jgi:hypothetical protein
LPCKITKVKALWHWNACKEDRHYQRQTTPMIG